MDLFIEKKKPIYPFIREVIVSRNTSHLEKSVVSKCHQVVLLFSKGLFNYYVRVFWVFFELLTYIRTLSVNNEKDN